MAATPASSKEGSKFHVLCFLLAILALAVTFFSEFTDMYVMGIKTSYGVFDQEVFTKTLTAYLKNPQIYTGMLLAWVLPLFALLLAFIRKKPAALVCMIFTGLVLVLQFICAAYYPRYTQTYGGSLSRLWFRAYQFLNGEHLFRYLRYTVSVDTYLLLLQHLFVQVGYFLKNILVILACLPIVCKKQK